MKFNESPPGKLENQSELAGPDVSKITGNNSLSPAPGDEQTVVLGGRAFPQLLQGQRLDHPWERTYTTAFCLHWLFIYDLKCCRN